MFKHLLHTVYCWLLQRVDTWNLLNKYVRLKESAGQICAIWMSVHFKTRCQRVLALQTFLWRAALWFCSRLFLLLKDWAGQEYGGKWERAFFSRQVTAQLGALKWDQPLKEPLFAMVTVQKPKQVLFLVSAEISQPRTCRWYCLSPWQGQLTSACGGIKHL